MPDASVDNSTGQGGPIQVQHRTGRVPFIDVSDIAAAALAVLTAPTPLNTEFVPTGDEPMSYDRVAELISQVCGRRISHPHISIEEMAERAS